MAKFVKGDRVGIASELHYYPDGDVPVCGIITDELSDGRVMIKWDSEWKNRDSKPVDPGKLISEAELNTKYSELETVFIRVEKEIHDKLVAAGALVHDAGSIAKAAGFDLTEMYEAVSPLKSAMGKVGWNTSSWSC